MPRINLEPLIEPAINSAIKVLADHPQLLENALQALALALTAQLEAFIAKSKAPQG